MMKTQSQIYLEKAIEQVIDLFYANKIVPQDAYGGKMEQLLHELINEAITDKENTEMDKKLIEYKTKIHYYGFQKADIFQILAYTTQIAEGGQVQ